MRRTLAGFLFALSYIALCLAAGGWLLQRAAFDPDQTAAAAPEILREPAIRKQLSTQIATATAKELRLSVIQAEALVNSVMDNAEGAEILSDILRAAHARLIGETRAPAQIPAKQLVQIVRDEHVGELPPVTVKVPRVAALDVTRAVLDWAVPLAAIAAIVLFVLGLTAHPDRPALVRSMGYGLIALGLCLGVLGYIIPKFLIPVLSDSIWVAVPARLADHQRWLVLAVVLILCAAGAALLASAGMMRQQRRWSTPINMYRYSEERRWG